MKFWDVKTGESFIYAGYTWIKLLQGYALMKDLSVRLVLGMIDLLRGVQENNVKDSKESLKSLYGVLNETTRGLGLNVLDVLELQGKKAGD